MKLSPKGKGLEKFIFLKKEVLVIALIFTVLFLISCTSMDGGKNETEVSLEEGMGLPCKDNWVCLSSEDIVHRLENCSLVERKTCPLGCKNDSCRIGKTCETGFKCRTETTRGLQDSACQWSKETICDWGCAEGKCNPEPENATNVTEVVIGEEEEEEEEIVIPKALPTLTLGELKIITVNEAEHNLSIYTLEPEQVKIILDTKRSDWLLEGDNHTFPNGIQITIVDIFFQSYPGGKQEISYRVE